jgi:valyl-tRNA synthetase
MPVEPMTLPDGRKSNSSPKFDLGRNFANKLWNASRFAMMKIAGAPPWDSINPTAAASDAWILSRLARTIRDATEALSAYRFHEAADVLYKYMWNDFCDWYLEIAKARLNAGEQSPKAVLAYGLDQLLRLLHPMMPFITEAIWAQLNSEMPYRGPGEAKAEPILAKAAWPRARFEWINDDLERQFGGLIELIGGIRQVRAEHDVPAGKKIKLTLAAAGDDARRLGENAELFKALAGVESVNFDPAASAGGNDSTITVGNMRAFVHDVIDREAELARLNKQLEMLTKGIRSIEGKLANEKFVAKAPPAVVEAERRRLAELSGQLEAVQKSLAALG